jgi:hypothetical protein
MPNVTITLDDAEQIRVEEILMDRDEKAALEFLKRVIKARIERQQKGRCQPPV